MKRIPKSFRLMGHTITVTVIPRNRWTFTDCVGFFDPTNNTISLMKQDRSILLHTCWHEITHAILHAMNHKLYSNEAFVDQMGGLIAQILDSAE